MHILTATVTFTAGTAVVLSTIANFASIKAGAGVTKIRIEPAAANAHVCFVGDALLATGTSTVDHVIRQLAVPTSATAVLDSFTDETSQNVNSLFLTEFSVDGTTNEQARVTLHVG